MEFEKKEKKTKVMNFQTTPTIDRKLQDIADMAGVPRVAVIEKLIEETWKEYKELRHA